MKSETTYSIYNSILFILIKFFVYKIKFCVYKFIFNIFNILWSIQRIRIWKYYIIQIYKNEYKKKIQISKKEYQQ